MDTAHQNAPAGAPESGMRQPAPDGRPASDYSPLVASTIARLEMSETFYRQLEEMFPGAPMTDEQVATMNHNLGHPKDASYRPYCTRNGCRDMPRMYRVEQGFKCWSCQNVIGFDLRRIVSENASDQTRRAQD